jgi:hypothetical protein
MFTDPNNYTSEFKELVSPFHPVFQTQTTNNSKQTRPICNCDDDNEDYGMAPECAFVCNMLSRDSRKSHNATKKWRSNGHDAKKTRRK